MCRMALRGLSNSRWMTTGVDIQVLANRLCLRTMACPDVGHSTTAPCFKQVLDVIIAEPERDSEAAAVAGHLRAATLRQKSKQYRGTAARRSLRFYMAASPALNRDLRRERYMCFPVDCFISFPPISQSVRILVNRPMLIANFSELGRGCCAQRPKQRG
jgi:hypothetical protein